MTATVICNTPERIVKVKDPNFFSPFAPFDSGERLSFVVTVHVATVIVAIFREYETRKKAKNSLLVV